MIGTTSGHYHPRNGTDVHENRCTRRPRPVIYQRIKAASGPRILHPSHAVHLLQTLHTARNEAKRGSRTMTTVDALGTTRRARVALPTTGTARNTSVLGRGVLVLCKRSPNRVHALQLLSFLSSLTPPTTTPTLPPFFLLLRHGARHLVGD